MNLLRFVATLLLISIPCLAQQVDYRALGTNSFFTNGLRVDSKHWTNETDATVSYMRPVDQARSLAHVQTSSNYYGFYQELLNTNNQTFTVTHFMVNKSTNSGAKGPYYWDGAYGGLFESDPEIGIVKAGDGVGVLGVADSLWSRQIGAAGYAESAANNQTNVGVTAIASSHGFTGTTRVGLYAETGDQTRALVTDAVLTNSVIQANSRSGDFLFRGQTNGQSTIQVRADGSTFVGKNVDIETSLSNFGSLRHPFVISFTGSNQAPVSALWGTINNEDYNHYGYCNFSVQTNVVAFNLQTEDGTGEKNLRFRVATGQDIMTFLSSGVPLLTAGPDGDLDVIKSVAYSWPIGYGSESNYVLTMTNNTGALDWQPGLLSPTGTNIIRSIATNAVSATAIGPGTNNFLAKFNSTGTNVINSPLYSAETNYVWQRQSAVTGGTYTNAATNAIFGAEAHANTNAWLEFVSPSVFGNQAAHIRHKTSGYVSQRAAIVINDSWSIEPPVDFLGGHAAGALLPVGANDTYKIGDSSSKVNQITVGTGFIEIGIPASTSFPGLRIGASDCGVSSRGVNDLSFWRPTTGITAAFDRERRSGSLQFDLAGNYLGFGVGISNTVCFLGGNDQIIAGLGLLGVVQVGTNNNTAGVVPLSVGFIGAPGVGADRHGTDIKIIGGPSSGTGTNGNVRLQTSEKALATSSTINSNQKDRLHIIADPMILTTNAATTVFSFTVPTTLKAAGITVFAHTEIENGVDVAATDEMFIVNANNKAGTVVASTPSAPITTTSSSGGSAAIANTWSTSVTGTRVDVQLTCVTSGILSTNSTCRVTLIPNSSAIPVITHP